MLTMKPYSQDIQVNVNDKSIYTDLNYILSSNIYGLFS